MSAIPAAGPPAAVVERLAPGTNVIVPLANGEPVAVLDAIEAAAAAGRLRDVRVHQMHALYDRPYLDGRYGSDLRHVSYFLSHVTRQRFHDGTVDLVPCNFSEVPALLRRLERPLVVASTTTSRSRRARSIGTSLKLQGTRSTPPSWKRPRVRCERK